MFVAFAFQSLHKRLVALVIFIQRSDYIKPANDSP